MNDKPIHPIALTLDAYCKQPEGTFKKFIERQEEQFREMERWRKARIRAARKP